jgi:predicted nucleotidyltransferase
MDDITTTIIQALHDIERREQVRILYACESGSRAWGFASHDSDYDVRFLYVRPKDAYLHLDLPRDVIELPIVGDLDINGWDIFKALRLLRNSNPPLLEWLFSPIVYLENCAYLDELRSIARRLYSSESLHYHYSSMADRNYRQYLKDKAEVILKKYLYVLRPLIALLFMEQRQQIPPTSFQETLAQVQLQPEVGEHIRILVARKLDGDELGTGQPDAVLNAFIDERLKNWQRPSTGSPHKRALSQELDQALTHILNEAE